ncbi:DUF3618 domain-containing protein [Nocardia sp. NPDC056000]|uniref:DUF3618 domain-containing protein n=1 Tax=Nocardia sp. NPDC056000 TaxID=3345674 RepID=UPI0035D7DD5E
MNDATGPLESDAAEQLRRDREQTRQELGQTVAELADKADVRARAEDNPHETAEAARLSAANATEQAHEIADQARTQATHVAEAVAAKTPAPVTDRGRQIAGIARRYPVPLVAAVVSGAALIWWTARRRQA